MNKAKAKKKGRKLRVCPQCTRIFKNFRWRKDFIYDRVACCPYCGIPAYKWEKIIKKGDINGL